jgi:hypothetical protein
MSVTISARKRCSVRFCLPLLIGGLVSRSRCLCLYVYSGVQRMSCCNFLRCVAGFSRRSIIDLPLLCSLMCISSLCTLCCRFLWIVYYWFAPSVFSNVYFVLCALYFRFLWIVYYWFAPSVFSNVYFVLCTLCCRFLWIVYYWFAPSVFSNVYFVLFMLFVFVCLSNTYCAVFLFCFSSSCVPYVASFSRLSVFACLFGIL